MAITNFDNTSVDVESLKPFQKFIMRIGNVPSSYLEAMTYPELVMWFCDYLQNQVIPTVNNNGEAVSELQNLYNELKTYVENYFNNLDVQEEINNKLDKMAESGDLTNLIKNYVDPIQEDFETDINAEMNAFKSNVNTSINIIDNKVNRATSGSPLVASNTSEMTDTTRVYVNISDGYWYYYDGDTWERGGVYQASEDSKTLTQLSEDMPQAIDTRKINIEIGSLNTSSGIKITGDNRVRSSDYILKQHDFKINLPSNVKISLRFYKDTTEANNSYLGYTDWLTTEEDVKNHLNDYPLTTVLKIVMGYINDDEIEDISDFENIFMYIMPKDYPFNIEFTSLGPIGSGSSTTYSKTEYFPLEEGDVLQYSLYYRGSNTIIAFYDENKAIVKQVLGMSGVVTHAEGIEKISSAIKYVSFNGMNSTHSEYVEDSSVKLIKRLDVDVYNIKKDIAYLKKDKEVFNAPIVPTFSVLCAKEMRYNDGSNPQVDWYLLCNPSTNELYYSKDLKNKKYLFTFDRNLDIGYYKFAIRQNGDIIAVYRNEFSSQLSGATGHELDAIRRNPFVYLASEEYKIKHEVDFGEYNSDTLEGLKPTGWLENCGLCSLPNGDLIFGEYTRLGILSVANAWRIKANVDITDASNWEIIKQFNVAPTNGDYDMTYIEHFHAVQYDYYSDIIYLGTGDNYKKSQILYSLDGGDTWTNLTLIDPDNQNEVIYGEKLFRILNYNFTQDYIYWSSDSSAEHGVFRCTRNDEGLIDKNSVEILATIDTTTGKAATYGTAYIQEINALILMERNDVSYKEMLFRAFDLNDNTLKTIDVLKSVNGNDTNVGFRTEYTKWDVSDGIIICGFGKNSKYANKNKGFGNMGSSWENNINNIWIKPYRDTQGNIKCVFGLFY